MNFPQNLLFRIQQQSMTYSHLCECSRLVREDVLYLAELLIEGRTAGLCRVIFQLVVHLRVPVYQQAVPHTDDLHTGIAAESKGNRWELSTVGWEL